MSNTTILIIFAAVNVIVTGLFAGLVTRQYAKRHRVYQLFWMIALLMSFIATLSYVSMVLAGPTSSAGIVLFRLYYILGGALAPSWLGLGSIALVAGPKTTRILAAALLLVSAVTAVLVAINPIDTKSLAQVAGTSGTGILVQGVWLVFTITLNSLGWAAVAGVAVYSGWKLLRRVSSVAGFHPGNLLWANVLILVGASIIAYAGASARVGFLVNSFWLFMALGWVGFYAGVVLTGRRKVPAVTPASQPEGAAHDTVAQA
jgi:hypothetical protein